MELVFVLTLREFEDPTGNEEETKADTDDEDPPSHCDTQDDHRSGGA